MEQVVTIPPSALPGISPSRGESRWSTTSATIRRRSQRSTAAWARGRSHKSLSPLEGEMPGRAEGGGPEIATSKTRAAHP
jgi:hypothetical protein